MRYFNSEEHGSSEEHNSSEDMPANSPFSAVSSTFLFTSRHQSIKTQGIFERINQAAQSRAGHENSLQSALQPAFQRARDAGQQQPIIVGAIPFDASQASCLFIPEHYQVCDRQALVDAACVDSRRAVTALASRSLPDENEFKHIVAEAVAACQCGAIHKVVLSRILEIDTDSPVDSDQVMNHLLIQNSTAHHFRVPLADGGVLLGASPELLVRKHLAGVYTNPLAGSAKRQTDPQHDWDISQALLDSEKDQYEHRLVIDEIRRLLTPHCSSLNIPLQPSLLSTAALWHLSSAISGELENPQMRVLELANLLHPTPALCGLPTQKARQLIQQLEPFERGLFSGIVGWCDEQGNGEWAVIIRCATVHPTQVRLFAGAGIVAASQPALEWAETEAKLGTMLNAIAITRPGVPL
ncbi:menaquinone-specific isochorismate synthase [Yersinia kristensenii]|nr:menaquinone-specific isochorismate synthase [Yersinia kristensenii]